MPTKFTKPSQLPINEYNRYEPVVFEEPNITPLDITYDDPYSVFNDPAISAAMNTENDSIPEFYNSLDRYQTKGKNVSSGSDNTDYFSTILNRESSNNYSAVNRLNYLGGYQMGASALIEAGLVKKGTTNKGLDNPKNWVGSLSKDSFLTNPELQNQAVRTYTNKNKKYLGDMYTNASPTRRKQLLASAHLIGAGATKTNMGKKDANGISGNDHAALFK
jgi:hypothetical protein